MNPMRTMLLIVSAVLLAIVGCAQTKDTSMVHEHTPEVAKHYDQSVAQWTDNKFFTIEMVIPDKELRMGVNSLGIIVHDKNDKDIPGAEVTITPWMPAMGHGVMEKPVVMERGGGLYSVSNVVLSMTGHWQLQVAVTKDGVQDKAVFDFPEVKPMGHEHAGMHVKAPVDLDLSTTKMSEKKLYKVSYKSLRGTIPLNRIHSWELYLKDTAGKPVDNATITIVGDMPEHGHGFPTQPEVVKGIGAGVYLVDGLKFSMPGWWVVTFHIMAGETMDNVTFNLQLR
jgi:hypothetical protein